MDRNAKPQGEQKRHKDGLRSGRLCFAGRDISLGFESPLLIGGSVEFLQELT